MVEDKAAGKEERMECRSSSFWAFALWFECTRLVDMAGMVEVGKVGNMALVDKAEDKEVVVGR